MEKCYVMISIYSFGFFPRTCKRQCFYGEINANMSGTSLETTVGNDIAQTVFRFNWNHVGKSEYHGEYYPVDYTTKCSKENLENNYERIIHLDIFNETFVMYQEPDDNGSGRYVILVRSIWNVTETIHLRDQFIEELLGEDKLRKFFYYIDIEQCMLMEEFCEKSPYSKGTYSNFETYVKEKNFKGDVRGLAANKVLLVGLIVLIDSY